MSLLDEWIEKAEGDYQTAVTLNRPRKNPLFDAVSYHCQQSAEKYLKAFLINRGTTPRRIHSLEALLTDCTAFDPTLLSLLPEVRIIDPYSVEFRYPGDFATKEDAREAVTTLRVIRNRLRRELGL